MVLVQFFAVKGGVCLDSIVLALGIGFLGFLSSFSELHGNATGSYRLVNMNINTNVTKAHIGKVTIKKRSIWSYFITIVSVYLFIAAYMWVFLLTWFKIKVW